MSVFFFCVHGERIVARNKQIGREPLRGSRDLFVPRYDSFPMKPEKKDTHSLTEQEIKDYQLKFQRRSPKFKDFSRTNSFSRTFQGKPKIQGLFKDCGNPVNGCLVFGFTL